MSTKTLGVVGRGSGQQNSIPTIPTVPTIPTLPTLPTPWGCSKLKPYKFCLVYNLHLNFFYSLVSLSIYT